MLSTMQIIIHLIALLLIVRYKQRCNSKNYRLDAGLLAFVIGGFNLAMIVYLALIQPKHAALLDYAQIAVAASLLGFVAKFGGNTARMIDWVKSRLA